VAPELMLLHLAGVCRHCAFVRAVAVATQPVKKITHNHINQIMNVMWHNAQSNTVVCDYQSFVHSSVRHDDCTLTIPGRNRDIECNHSWQQPTNLLQTVDQVHYYE
jgi:hypothetical protein